MMKIKLKNTPSGRRIYEEYLFSKGIDFKQLLPENKRDLSVRESARFYVDSLDINTLLTIPFQPESILPYWENYKNLVQGRFYCP